MSKAKRHKGKLPKLPPGVVSLGVFRTQKAIDELMAQGLVVKVGDRYYTPENAPPHE